MPSDTAIERPYHHGDLRAALLACARELLEEGGPAALSVREIARRVGVAAPSVYHHFNNLDGIALALAEQGFDAFARQLQAAAAKPQGRLRDMGEAYVAFARANPNLYRLMFGEGIRAAEQHATLRALRRQAFDKLEAGLRQRLPAAEVPDAALYLWSLTHGLSLLIIDGQLGEGADVEARIRATLQHAGTGLQGPSRPESTAVQPTVKRTGSAALKTKNTAAPSR